MEEGLQREFMEELGVKVRVGEPFYVFTYTRNKEGVELHVVEVIYFVELADENQVIKLRPEDHSEYQWITAHEVDTCLNPDDEETKAVRRGFKLSSDLARK
jgi:ADP-ribose pyrophosphatase YjhB (NUDIX family)